MSGNNDDRIASTDDLRDKIVAQRSASDNGQQNGVVERRGDNSSEIIRKLRSMKDEYGKAIPTWMDPEMVVRDAVTAVRNSWKLSECTVESVLGAVMSVAQLGLRVGVLDQAWVLPYWNKHRRGYAAQMIIGYRGYVELCYRSGRVLDMNASVVYRREMDETCLANRLRHSPGCECLFKFRRVNAAVELTHQPDLTIQHALPRRDGDPDGAVSQEPIFAFYATARLKGNGYAVTDPWNLSQMEAHRERYGNRDKDGNLTGPWVTQFPAMGRKTMVKELTRLLPKSAEMAHALAADGGFREEFPGSVNFVMPGEATQFDDDSPAGEQ